MKERRASLRVPVNRSFRSVRDFAMTYLANVSSSGAFIATENPAPVGTQFSMSFTIEEAGGATIVGTGEVVRVSESPAGMGVVFVKLTSVSQQLLERLLLRQMSALRPEDDAAEA